MVNLQAATARLAMAARVRKETTLPIKWIARLQVGTSKSLKQSCFIGDTPMRMPTPAHDAHNSSSNLRFEPFSPNQRLDQWTRIGVFGR